MFSLDIRCVHSRLENMTSNYIALNRSEQKYFSIVFYVSAFLKF